MKKILSLSLLLLSAIACTSQSPADPFMDNLDQAFEAVEKGKAGKQTPLLLFDFEEESMLEHIELHHSEVELLGSPGERRLQITATPQNGSAGITLHKPQGAWNLNGYFQVKMEVKNLHDKPIQIIFQVGDPDDSFERWQMQEVLDLEAGETKTVENAISVTPWLFSTPFELVGMFGPPGQTKTDLGNIKVLRVTTRFAEEQQRFEIDNIRAEGAIAYVDTTGFLPFMDRFGQYKYKNWPGKIRSEKDLEENRLEEEKDLEAYQEPPNRNQYGGWTAGPRFEATGYFRTQKHENRWWLVDPEGYLFWSNGVNCVHSHSGTTGIGGREKYFSDLPDKTEPYGRFYGRSRGSSRNFYAVYGPHTTYDFSSANLMRKYGEDWNKEFNRLAHVRLRSWGLNTFANASSKELYMESKTPYVATVWVRGTKKIEASSGYQGKFHDVFDPGYRKALRASLSRKTDESGDPWCLGFFIENEMSWGRDRSLALATLASPADQPAKIVFIEDLKAKYTSIQGLNEVWGSVHDSWEAMLESVEQPDEERAKEDLNVFYQKIATSYFRTVREEMDAVAPNHLYLGCRLAWANSDIVERTASKYCDVMSYNKYEYSVANVGLPEGVDMPIIIGEFHFGALDRGPLHVGIKSAGDQNQRGEFFKRYLESALNNPHIVGVHWFQYVDQATTGRGDGENYNVGLVDICDTPYPEMVGSMRGVGASLYEFRSNSRATKD